MKRWLAAWVVCVICINYCAAQTPTNAPAQKLWYRQPAAKWEEALPIGNGRWGASSIPEVRRLVLASKIKEGETPSPMLPVLFLQLR